MAEEIQYDDSLRQGTDKLNASIRDAEEAKDTAQSADTKATEALSQSESTQTQLDTIVIEGDSSVEAAQARVSVSGANYDTLKQRLDEEYEETTSQLAQNAENMLNEFLVRSKPQYGKLKLPDDFIDVDFDLYRDSKGIIQHSIDIDQFKKADVELWVSDNGSNSSGDGSESNPYRTVHRAFYKVMNTPDTSYCIYVSNSNILRGEFADEGSSTFINLDNKKVSIINTNDSILHVSEGQNSERGIINMNGGERNPALSWSLHEDTTYVSERSACAYVTDLSNINKSNGTVKKMVKKESVQEVIDTPNSFYSDGTDVYVNTFDGREPDEDIVVILATASLQFDLTNSLLYFEGFYFQSMDGILVQGDLDSTFVMNKVKIGRTTEDNGLNLRDVGTCYSFNTLIHDSFKDCFNYHYYNIPQADIRKVLAFEYHCEGFGAGIDDTMEGNNITTMHEGANMLRVGCVGKNTRGTPCADINGSYSVLFDCYMSGTVADENSNFSNAYYFFTDENKSGLGATVYMENCGGRGKKQDILIDEGTVFNLKSYSEGLDRITNDGTLNIVS